MSLEKRINAFVQLGLFLKQFGDISKNDSLSQINGKFYDEFDDLILRQKAYNGWFTKDNVLASLMAIGDFLLEDNLKNWTENYSIKNVSEKSIGIIMAGNIPLVGFHDMLCVLIAGHHLQAKLSSNDNTLIRKIGEIIIFTEPSFTNKITFKERLDGFDAIIATGSNNAASYFHSYFGRYPHIIRKNRNSVAIINENDKADDLKNLGKDVFQYFGLGCRSVSKLYLPKGYRIDTIFEAFYDDYQDIINNNKYANNYDYNKAVYLLGNNKMLDNGFLLLKEDEGLASPVGVLYYEYYTSVDKLKKRLLEVENELQCVVSSVNTPITTLKFGEAQCPSLSDYADGIDTMQFLLGLN